MKLTPAKIGGLQALGLVSYISLIALFFGNANQIFGPVDQFWAPILFLSLFVVSALICALIVLSYPFLMFWDKKKPRLALEIVLFTALWLAVFVLGFILVAAINR